MDAANSTSGGFTSMLVNSKYASVNIPPQLDYVVETISNAGFWTILFTLFALCVVYDQCASQTLLATSPTFHYVANHHLCCS